MNADEWQRFERWLKTLEGGEVSVKWLLDDFPEFPEKRIKGYVKPSGEPTVAVGHLKDVADRYGDEDGDGYGGPSEASDHGDKKLQISHNTTVPQGNREYEGSMVIEADEDEDTLYQTVREKAEEINAIHGSDTAE